MSAHKRIGILTSGGDCAGLNAAIRAVVHRAIDARRLGTNWNFSRDLGLDGTPDLGGKIDDSLGRSIARHGRYLFGYYQ
jgi:Phosphofructokinase